MLEKLSVIGIVHSVGEYEGNKYDNYVLHCIKPADAEKGQKGQLCEIIKIKASLLDEVPELNSFIIPYYDRFGRVSSIELC